MPQVDLREDLHLLQWGSTPLVIVNLDVQGSFHQRGGDSVVLTRDAGLVDYRAVGTIDACLAALTEVDDTRSCLLTNLTIDVLDRLDTVREPYLLGGYAGEYWLLSGPVLASVPADWQVR